MRIRPSKAIDQPQIKQIHLQAFGEAEGAEIAELVTHLLADATAAPLLSLVAEDKDVLCGHIIFTKTDIIPQDDPTQVASVSSRILAPLAVVPAYQNRGIGTKLIQEGLQQLKAAGVQLVFVLGHPDYYPRYGFVPAGTLGLTAIYPVPPEQADAWMVLALQAGFIGQIQGKVQVCDALNQPQYW